MGLIKRKYFKNADTKYGARGGIEPVQYPSDFKSKNSYLMTGIPR
jgi:hypothetical protein